ncbi:MULTISPECIES: murein hydrolase activator NlpD [Providencia]|uniref:Murein hydrolase activator NlpD n=1 Tax=Providencia rettgeri TaxID=587 RepID=A0A379FNA4_PRORE|nr:MULTISPECIES: murein hydrolase activator NlpD [Providencia]EJD6375910.1 murein hydrolase activator NlpD [Providencia rettgeri]EJF7710893.1 murein hydrolase activator NlpD [Providencia rettgeri]ELR5118589.1 murein hydrolase activator NlpD [Providencia rettgeri]MBI6201307.1 murein hydrolase activator NlpD [Providencia rettgeri]MCG5278871.1 murein hydrolase activator NlpD [Providencia rettgeri]
MKIVSPISRIRWAVIFSFSGALLAGCSTPYHTAAPISSVNDSQSSQPTVQRTTPASSPNMGMSTAMPSSRPNISNNSNTQPVSRSSAPVTTNGEGRIVYNRDYGSIPKGSYSGNSYTVQRGDTLFYIAYLTGNDFRELASRNNIPEPYSLNVGQVINIGNTNVNSNTQLAANSSNSHQQAVDLRTTNEYPANSGGQTSGKMLPNNKKPATQVSTTTTTSTTTASTAVSSTNNSSIKWRWPADGKMIEGFSDAQGGNKGVDIAGSRGQAVLAAAPGKVVYAGNALRGYGNLIIIKHNDDYLSAYAHNDTLLVRDQQDVTAGQKIATMGSTGTSSVRLHFEIRYKGKSVNPLRYLPQR